MKNKEERKTQKKESKTDIASAKKINQKEVSVKDTGKNKNNLEEKRCNDRDCPFHGDLKARGRIFKGEVIRKFPRRITIMFERMIYIRKYERYARQKTKIHARLSECMEESIKIGDLVSVQECRPLSKIIYFVTIKKIKDASESGGKVK